MNQNDLDFFKNWFSDYCKSFYSTNEEDNKNISLKEQHAYNVCENIREILEQSPEFTGTPNSKLPGLAPTLRDGAGKTPNSKLIAETVALFHDIGRFPQYARYRTFKDNISVNHGLLGAKTLIESKVLQSLPEDEQDLIIDSVKFHGVFKIPQIQDSDKIFFLKLIRDADKLDIYRVFIEYYETPTGDRASAAGLGLPDTLEYSRDVLSCFHKKQVISYTTLKTLCDFKLMQLSWVYDLNFKASFRLLQERDYVERFATKLPQTKEIQGVITLLKEYIHQRLNSDNRV